MSAYLQLWLFIIHPSEKLINLTDWREKIEFSSTSVTRCYDFSSAAIPRTSDKSNRVEIRRQKIELRNAFITRCGVTFPCLVQLLITDWPRLFKLSTTTTSWSPRSMMDHGSHSPGCPALTHHHTHYLTCPGVISSPSPTRFSVSNYILFCVLFEPFIMLTFRNAAVWIFGVPLILDSLECIFFGVSDGI